MTDRREAALTSVVGVVLMIAVSAALAGGGFWMYKAASAPPEPKPLVRATAVFDEAGYRAILVGDAPVTLQGTTLVANIDGVDRTFALTSAAAQMRDGKTWRQGEVLCVVGSSGCLASSGQQVGMKLIRENREILELGVQRAVPTSDPVASEHPAQQEVQAPYLQPRKVGYVLGLDGSILVQCAQDVVFRVTGSEAVLPSIGTIVPVNLWARNSPSASWTPMFNGNALSQGQTTTFHVPAGSHLQLMGTGSLLGLFTYVAITGVSDLHAPVREDGGAAPAVPGLAGLLPTDTFLQGIVDTVHDQVVLPEGQLASFFEFGTSLTGINADFNDLVMGLTFPVLSC